MRCQLAERVEKALVKFGFSEVKASCDCTGDVEITGTVANPNDSARLHVRSFVQHPVSALSRPRSQCRKVSSFELRKAIIEFREPNTN